MINSKAKGKAGELEFSNWLRDNLGVQARRGQQYSGGNNSPDVISDLPLHLEIKRVEKLNLSEAMRQAVQDAGEFPPVVCHRKNREDWLITMRAEDWYNISAAIIDHSDPDSSLPFANSTKGITKHVTGHKEMPNNAV